MLFNSHEFIFIFLPFSLVLFAIAGLAGRRAVLSALVLSSLSFYAFWTPVYVLLLLTLLVANYLMGKLLARMRSKPLLALGVASNLAVLCYYKYLGFLQGLFDAANPISVILPLGISFFIFQKIVYLVDSYKGLVVKHDFLEFSVFVTFFPQLIAGPITHPNEILPQLSNRRFGITAQGLCLGITLFSFGLFKKVAIADHVSAYSTPVFRAAQAGGAIGFADGWTAAFAYAMQIYFDFSGYSDMAAGLALLFGVRLPINFDSPYRSFSIIDFWRRWHISLSRFLRDYVYIPLGGSRLGHRRRLINLMLVMGVGGLWHGAGWTFICWGLLHGAMLIVNHLWRQTEASVRFSSSSAYRAGAWLLTFICVVLAWVPFRAPSLEASGHIYSAMLLPGAGTVAPLVDLAQAWIVIGFAAGLALLAPNAIRLMSDFSPVLLERAAPDCAASMGWRWKPNFFWALIAALALALGVAQATRPSEFLYFQF